MTEHVREASGRPLVQRLAVQIQIHLPGTIGRLLKQVRDLERIAPLFVEAGLVRPVRRPASLSVNVAGVATKATVTRVLGGFLYAAAAVRTDLSIAENVLSSSGQHSTCEIDDIDYEDQSKRFQLIGVQQAYQMADAALRSDDHFDLILLDCPLVLNRSMVPPTGDTRGSGYRATYERALAGIAGFWGEHREKLFPWNPRGTIVAGLATERFGAIVDIAQQDLRTPEGRSQLLGSDGVNFDRVENLLGTGNATAGIGPRRFVSGILGLHSRTAAFRMNAATPRMEPSETVDLGIIGFHFRAGIHAFPRLIQLVGDEPLWGQAELDRLAGLVTALQAVGGRSALPLPIHLAACELDSLDRFLATYSTAVRQGIESKGFEDLWLTDLDILETNGESS